MIHPDFAATGLYFTSRGKKKGSVDKGPEELRGSYIMNRLIALMYCSGAISALLLVPKVAEAAKISGTISATMSIAEDSELVGDVTCNVTGVPCLDIVAPNVTLDLNGFSITGQGDPQTGCSGSNGPATEQGIRILSQTGVTVRGPGIVQRFRNFGIVINGSTGTTVTGVTTSTNCNSGIFLTGGASLSVLEGNFSIRNGNSNAPCGGI